MGSHFFHQIMAFFRRSHRKKASSDFFHGQAEQFFQIIWRNDDVKIRPCLQCLVICMDGRSCGVPDGSVNIKDDPVAGDFFVLRIHVCSPPGWVCSETRSVYNNSGDRATDSEKIEDDRNGRKCFGKADLL